MIPLASLLHSLPRLASMSPFLWAIFAQCECPAIVLKSGVEQQRSSGVVEALASRLLHYSCTPLSSYLGFFFVSFRVVGFFVAFFVGFLVIFVGFLTGTAGFAGAGVGFFLSVAFAGCSLAAAPFFFASAAAAPFAGAGGATGFVGSGSGFVGRFGRWSLQFGSISSINLRAAGPYGFRPTSTPN